MSIPGTRIFPSPCDKLVPPRGTSTSALTILLSSEDAKDASDVHKLNNEAEVFPTFPLTDLPNELIDHIFSFLDSIAPSELNFNAQPSSAFTSAEATPLKNISKVSKRLRGIVFPRLFANIRLDPYKLTPFLIFFHQHDLAKHVETIVANLQGPCNHLHPAWWARLLNEVPTRTFTIICAPHVFAELVNTSVVSADAWAFNMPYQILRLRQSLESVNDHISLTELPSLFAARKWTELSVNEGSSLKAYTTYVSSTRGERQQSIAY
jgi:hypothetical protein